MEQNTVSEPTVAIEAQPVLLEQSVDPVSAISDISTNAIEAVTTAASAPNAVDSLAIIEQLSDLSIYLIGGSFVLGSLFTILILLLLDFMRRNKTDESK